MLRVAAAADAALPAPEPMSPASPELADKLAPAAPAGPEANHRKAPSAPEVKLEPGQGDAEPTGARKTAPASGKNASGMHCVVKRERENREAAEAGAKRQRFGENDPSSSGSPSMSAEVKDEAEAKNSEREDRDTPPPSGEPRRGNRAATKKPVATRQLNGKNFLKNILPNITRLSRTEILQDLRVMEGNVKAR